MNRYLVRFSKEGYIKYTSHLDMVRLFKRAFKKTGLCLQYSQGYNPHPKMGFVQPLSLGYSSIFELIEIETKEEFEPQIILDRLNGSMPEGIRILEVSKLPDGGKTIAALTEYAEYKIQIPLNGDERDFETVCRSFLEQTEIIASKEQKKTGKIVEKNIRPLIKKLSGTREDDKLIMTTNIDQGSVSNLSPELLIDAFLRFSGLTANRSEIEVERTRIIYKVN